MPRLVIPANFVEIALASALLLDPRRGALPSMFYVFAQTAFESSCTVGCTSYTGVSRNLASAVLQRDSKALSSMLLSAATALSIFLTSEMLCFRKYRSFNQGAIKSRAKIVYTSRFVSVILAQGPC